MTPLQEQELTGQLAALERRLTVVEAVLARRARKLDWLDDVRASRSTPPPEPRVARAPEFSGTAAPEAPGTAAPKAPGTAPPERAWRRRASISDLVGGRVLAWLGGIATLLGIALFLVLAISRGWITVELRVVLAGLTSSLLMAMGVWLHAKRGRTEASVVLVGVATAGWLATLLVASHVYDLVPPLVAVLGSILVGSVATVLAIRWAGQAIGALGLLGGLISPLLVGAPLDELTVGILAVAAACVTWTAISRRWHWLAVLGILLAVPQWGWFVLGGHPSAAVALAVLACFSAVGLAGAMGISRSRTDSRPGPCAAAAVTLNALAAALIGAVALRQSVGGHGPELWLAALAAAHAAAAAWRPRLEASTAVRRLLVVLAAILADIAFGLSFSGLVLAIGWGAAAVGLAAMTVRPLERTSDRRLVEVGLGAHIALTTVRAVLLAPPATLGSGSPQLVPLLALATLAASCLVSAHLAQARSRELAPFLDGLGLVAVAYLTAQALSGPALVASWALEALALIQLDAGGAGHQARWGAAGFLALGVLHTLVVEAPPDALVTGARSLSSAAVALGAITLATALAAYREPRLHRQLLAASSLTLLYLGSVVIITAFQPSPGSATLNLLDLSVREQGQVVLSVCWSLVGVGSLVLGLRRNLPWVRNAALALLLAAVAKVFLYDLSTLTSLYRVASFIALGLLLLGGAFAYQRLRPPPVPDMRTVHPSQR